MHASAVLQSILRPVSVRLDVRNARNLLLAVRALVCGRRLTLMELARHWPGAERVRAPLKRLDRLLGNHHVHALRAELYGMAVKWLLRSPCATLIVDWSELKSDGRWHLLRAAVVARGRTITLYEEVHPEAKKNNSAVEVAFLKRLHALVPAGVRPVVVTDAGFRGPWFRAVQAVGWHWVGRVSSRTRVRLAKGGWFSCKSLHRQASAQARSLGAAYFAQSNPLGCRVLLVRRPKQGRVELTRYGRRAQSSHSRTMAKRAKQPWVLAASGSLDHLSACAIVKLYAKRMQIEQSFRDLKSHRYGCAFEDTLTRDPRRLETLLLIHMLATLAAWLAALATSSTALASSCVSSLIKRYSFLWLGWARLRLAAIASSSPPTSCAASRLHELIAPAP
jgi:hypothetical protein